MNASIASTAPAGPLEDALDRAVDGVGGAAGDSEALGLPARGVAKEDSLHLAMRDHPAADRTHADTVER
jgi:hypothetical protein